MEGGVTQPVKAASHRLDGIGQCNGGQKMSITNGKKTIDEEDGEWKVKMITWILLSLSFFLAECSGKELKEERGLRWEPRKD